MVLVNSFQFGGHEKSGSLVRLKGLGVGLDLPSDHMQTGTEGPAGPGLRTPAGSGGTAGRACEALLGIPAVDQR
jgi:hypothetical protein